MLKDHGTDFLVSQFEGGGLLSQPTLRDLMGPFSVRATLQWMDLLLAALDCYNTFINLHIMKPHHMLSKSFTPWVDRYLPQPKSPLLLDGPRVITFFFPLHAQDCKEKSRFLKALNFFLTELATHELTAAESCFSLGEKTSHFSPREVDQYNYSKCTIIIRLLEFATMTLVKGDQEFWKVSLSLKHSP